jgi:D-beta-D-heptose 7-phosphate kinase / D-beta-D-heptose 1-phosphate adenosyltransferase
VTGRIVVAGDILLDRDISGSADRLCPDAPVPVLTEMVNVARPGGAGLAAAMLAHDGAEVRLIGCVGRDDAGDLLRRLLAGAGVELIELPYDGPTAEKIRLRAGRYPLLRLDRGTEAGACGELTPAAATALGDASAVLVSDHGRGILGLASLRRLLAAIADATEIVWDPHPQGATPVPGARLVCPNRAEAAGFAAGYGAGPDGDGSPDGRPQLLPAIAGEAQLLRGAWRAGAVAVTLGQHGALLAVAEAPVAHFPAPVVRDGDACGAGDRFSSAALAGLARGLAVADAVEDAVVEASRYVAADGPASLRFDTAHVSTASTVSTASAASTVDVVGPAEALM